MKTFSINSAKKNATEKAAPVKYVSVEDMEKYVNAVMKAYGVSVDTNMNTFKDGNTQWNVIVPADERHDEMPKTKAGAPRARIATFVADPNGGYVYVRIDCGMLPEVAAKLKPFAWRKETTEEPAEEPKAATFSAPKKATAPKRTATKKADTPTETPKAGKVTTARRRRSA